MNPILLLHGALGSAEQLLPLKNLIQASGREVFSLNFSGHGGQSFATEFGITRFAEETLQYIHSKNLKKFDVFGYSMGGYVALYAALLQPECFGTIVTLGTKFDWSKESSEAEVRKLNPEKIEEKVPAFAASLSRRHAPNDWKVLVKKTADMMLALGENPILPSKNLQRLQQKIIIALGDRDELTSAEYSSRVAEQIPNGRFILLENTPHVIEKVNPDTVHQLLQEHLY